MVRRHSCKVKDPQGNLVKGWRIGPNKTFQAFQWVPKCKYLGTILSYGHFELQTLQFRIGEAKQEIHAVRKFVYNRRVASTKARLRIWQSTVMSTLLSGLPDVGLSKESAAALRSWHAYKTRSVLNQPAHISRVTTTELFAFHSIADPVSLVRARIANRLRKIERRAACAPDITTRPEVLEELRRKLKEIDSLPAPDVHMPESQTCPDCSQCFHTAHGLHTHRARQHPQQITRYVPPAFDRQLHALEGLPQCSACLRKFKQWKGLRDHLLSGACPEPEKLRSVSESATQPVSAEVKQLQQLRGDLEQQARPGLGGYAARPSCRVLNNRCVHCNFWTPDRTKVKSHFRQAHPQKWADLNSATVSICQGLSILLTKGQECPFCGYRTHDRRLHPEQCPVLYQVVSFWLQAQREPHATSTGHSPTPLGTPSRQAEASTAPVSSGPPGGTDPQRQSLGRSAAGALKGVRPLANTGNTCYANAVMQALMSMQNLGCDMADLKSVLTVIAPSLFCGVVSWWVVGFRFGVLTPFPPPCGVVVGVGFRV